MYQFAVYFFRPVFAEHFYFKIQTIKDFLNECYEKPTTINQKQKKFVLERCDVTVIIEQLERIHGLTLSQSGQLISIQSGDYFVEVNVQGNRLQVVSDQLESIDRMFFQALKSLHRYTFIMNASTNESGWLTPLQKKKVSRFQLIQPS